MCLWFAVCGAETVGFGLFICDNLLVFDCCFMRCLRLVGWFDSIGSLGGCLDCS